MQCFQSNLAGLYEYKNSLSLRLCRVGEFCIVCFRKLLCAMGTLRCVLECPSRFLCNLKDRDKCALLLSDSIARDENCKIFFLLLSFLINLSLFYFEVLNSFDLDLRENGFFLFWPGATRTGFLGLFGFFLFHRLLLSRTLKTISEVLLLFSLFFSYYERFLLFIIFDSHGLYQVAFVIFVFFEGFKLSNISFIQYLVSYNI